MSAPVPAVIDLAAVSDARKKFLLALEGELLDYKHNVPQVNSLFYSHIGSRFNRGQACVVI